MAKNKNIEQSEIAKLKQSIRSLKGKLSHRDKKIKELKSELKTLQRALNESTVYIDDRLADVPVDKIVQYFSQKNKKNLKDVEVLGKLKKRECFKCDKGYLRLTIINRHDGQFYYRHCTECENRTVLKKYDDKVKE